MIGNPFQPLGWKGFFLKGKNQIATPTLLVLPYRVVCLIGTRSCNPMKNSEICISLIINTYQIRKFPKISINCIRLHKLRQNYGKIICSFL